MNEPKLCETCGDPVTLQGAQLCNGCWEVECRLERYAWSEKGRSKLRKALGQSRTPPAEEG